jgi:hypothetical protein
LIHHFIQIAVMTDGHQPDSPSLSTLNTPLSTNFWAALESVPGGSALYTTWSHQLGPDLETFTALFLRAKSTEPAQFVPCPWKCGCFHKIVPQDNGTLHGLCQCDPPTCGAYTVLPAERVTWELDRPKIGRALCRAFGLDFKIAQLGLYHTIQIGSWSVDAIPAILTLPASQGEFLHTLTLLIARLNRPFILFAPTARHFGLAPKELLATLGAIFIPLDSHLNLSLNHPSGPSSSPSPHLSTINSPPSTPSSPQLSTINSPPSTLFSDLSPALPETPDHGLASRVSLLLDDLDTGSRRKHPSLAAVFKLYFIQELPIAKVAKKCRCSVGTIVNRLKLIQSKTGATPDQLRRISPHFTQLHHDLTSAKSDYLRRRQQ